MRTFGNFPHRIIVLIMQTIPYDSQGTLVYYWLCEIPSGSPPLDGGGNKGGVHYSWRFSTSILPYLTNGAR